MFLFSLLQLSWKKHLFQLKPNIFGLYSSDVRDLFQNIFDCYDLKLFYWKYPRKKHDTSAEYLQYLHQPKAEPKHYYWEA